MEVSQNRGYLFGGPYNKVYSILGSILGYPNFGKQPYRPQSITILITGGTPPHKLSFILGNPRKGKGETGMVKRDPAFSDLCDFWVPTMTVHSLGWKACVGGPLRVCGHLRHLISLLGTGGMIQFGGLWPMLRSMCPISHAKLVPS